MALRFESMDYLLVGLLCASALCGPFWAYERLFYSRKRVIFGSTPWGVRSLAPWFPMLAAGCLAKVFLVEPFQVPSISMRPTLSPGSVVVASKWDYSVRLPFEEEPLWSTFEPKRGDVALFTYPIDRRTVFVKRILGLPGDKVEIDQEGAVWINSEPLRRKLSVKCQKAGEPSERESCREQWQESWGDRSWAVWQNARPGAGVKAAGLSESELAGCRKASSGRLACEVPEGAYFAMGDNRDDSLDSRYWGAVPRSNLIGRAVASFSFSSLSTSGLIR